ncbi:protein artemis-like [Maniola jurtina]|uniref:protein artemis-like n=1 Tax=Maniola jurtina TaxID=191418 RepID=UPI001E686CB1|nr:protein artemis-like [Maniola jurtina]
MCHIRSSFHGKIDEIPGVYADNFENADYTLARAYFLSHYHSDHVQGLQSDALLETLRKTQATIYTSELTAAIIDYEKSDSRLMKYVRGLKTGSSLITLPATEKYPQSSITVTLIPAGHCAGSTMFLFTNKTQKILFTGDFRINCNDLPNYTSLQENGAPIKLDTLYVDTTFINLGYENFPKRSESVDKLIFNVKKWLNCDINNAVAIYTPAKYGYEFVFNEIYEQMGVKVYVGAYKWKLYSTIQNLVPGVTNNENETKIHLCRYKSENNPHKECIGDNNRKFLYVYLSAMKWRNILNDFSSVELVTPTRLDVCFATHCSRKEIYYFVNYLSPDKIIGFPNKFVELGNKRTSELEFDRGIKKTRVDKKVDDKLLRLMFG